MNDNSIKKPTGNTGRKNLAEEILDTLWEPLLVLEEDLRVKSANDAFYHHFKVEPAETVGRQVYDLGNGQWDIPLLQELLEEVLPKETSIRDFEIQHTFERIGLRTLLLNARRIDHLQLILLAMEDITGRKENEALRAAKTAAEEASRAKSEFLANMSHEIRTPMTVFMAAIEHLLQIDRNPERRHLLGMAEKSAQRLRSLIDDILDFSRIEARRVDLEEEPFELRDCVREAIDLFVLPAREKGLRLEMQVAPEIPQQAVGDPGRLGQVLVNLIDNAVKFTHEGEIRVDVQPQGEFLEFSVADTGIGIPEEKRHRLFQSFSQVDSSFTRNFGGTGLGLAISKGLVDLMGGHIRMQKGEGQGSVFAFTVPLKTAAKKDLVPAETTSGYIDKEIDAPRILLAEDDSMIREMITMILAQRSWQVQTAESGLEALEKWATGNFAIVLMDVQMPKMNGLEATRVIREREGKSGKHCIIIGLTAHTRREIKEECLASGMDQVLTKPVKIQDLLSTVETYLNDRLEARNGRDTTSTDSGPAARQ